MKSFRSPFWRYTIFQIPSWILAAVCGWWLVNVLESPTWVAVGLPVMWLIKDMALFPILRSAYEINDELPIERMVGYLGTATERLAPRGYIFVRGELWRAETAAASVIEPNTQVEVIDAEGMTLKVRQHKIRKARAQSNGTLNRFSK